MTTLEVATKRLQQQADEMPCSCIGLLGETTGTAHWSSCQWDAWIGGFFAGVACAGLDVDALPDLRIGAKEARK